MAAPFTIRRADHVGFAVSSLDAALGFWVGLLGGTVLREGTMAGAFLSGVTGARGATVRFAVVEVAGQRIELLAYASTPGRRGPAPAPFDPGALHLAFAVEGMDALLHRAAARGWHPVGPPQPIPSGARAGTRVCYLVGPDGETVELMEAAPIGSAERT